MNIVLHIDVAKVTGCYSNVLTAKDALSADGLENPEVPIRVEEVEYGTYPKIKVDYIPIYEQGIEKIFGSDFRGVLNTDGYAAYNAANAKQWQSCLAHIIRNRDRATFFQVEQYYDTFERRGHIATAEINHFI